MRPLQHKCPTLRGDKDDKERQQTITCQKFHPNMGYLFHLMYAYITQGRPDRGLLRLTPRVQAIITQGIGVYAAPLLQPTQITARTAQGNPMYVYHPTAIARLPIPSDTDIIYFTDASGTQQRTPGVGCASVRITRHADGPHVEHHTGATIFGASSDGELRTLADVVTATPPPTMIRPSNIWVVVDATVDIHLTRRLGDLLPHKALESGLTTRALGLWMAFRGMHPQDALNIVKQESHRYAYGNGRADTQAKHQNTSHTPGLEHVRLDNPHRSHLQHLPPIPSATQPLQWIPEDTPYTDRDKQYHYPTPIQQLATTLGHPANTELLRRLEDSVHTPLYYSALRLNSLPAHLQKPRLQLALKQVPLLTRYHRWYARCSIHVPAGYTKCICGHAEEETWDHFKVCPLYRGLDTLTDWNPTHTIGQHAGWLTQSPATQQLTTVLKQTEVLEAVRRGLVPTAVYTLLRTHNQAPRTTHPTWHTSQHHTITYSTTTSPYHHTHTQPAHPQHHHHAIQHHPPPPLHRPTTHEPRYTPMDPRGAAHAHQQHQGLVGAPHHHQQPPHPHSIPASTIHQQPPITYGPQPHSDAHAAASHPHLATTTSQERQGPHSAHMQHPHDSQRPPDPQPAQHPPPPPPPPTVPPPHHPPPRPPPGDQATDATCGSQDQPIDVDAPADTRHRKFPLPRPPQETPSPDPTRDNDNHPPQPTPPPDHTPHHQPPHRPNPTLYTTQQRYGSTSGDSGTSR